MGRSSLFNFGLGTLVVGSPFFQDLGFPSFLLKSLLKGKAFWGEGLSTKGSLSVLILGWWPIFPLLLPGVFWDVWGSQLYSPILGFGGYPSFWVPFPVLT